MVNRLRASRAWKRGSRFFLFVRRRRRLVEAIGLEKLLQDRMGSFIARPASPRMPMIAATAHKTPAAAQQTALRSETAPGAQSARQADEAASASTLEISRKCVNSATCGETERTTIHALHRCIDAMSPSQNESKPCINYKPARRVGRELEKIPPAPRNLSPERDLPEAHRQKATKCRDASSLFCD